MNKHLIPQRQHFAVPSCLLSSILLLVVFNAASLTAQTDAQGRPITEDQLVNDADFANRGKTTKTDNDPGSTEITRDENGNVTDVKVKDGKGRVRREITIRRGEGRTTVETTDYRYGKTGLPIDDRSTTTTWEGEGTQVPTGRHTEIYDPTGRHDQNGEPVVTDSSYEEWRDGHWVPGTPSAPFISPLISSGQIKVDIAGTGETIGHIANLRLTNLTKNSLKLTIPPMILQSVSGKTQDYAVPGGQEVALEPGKTKTVPVDGVCLVRSKPPVAKGVTGDLVINDGGSESGPGSAVKIPVKNAQTMLRTATAIYEAAKQLEKDGALKKIPYSEPKKKQDIVVQWSTWMNPEISKLTGVPPATKQDLEKVVYKQVEQGGPVTAEKKKKIDEGINAIFEAIELTSEKAKDLEKAQPPKEISSAPAESVNAPEGSPPPGDQKQ